MKRHSNRKGPAPLSSAGRPHEMPSRRRVLSALRSPTLVCALLVGTGSAHALCTGIRPNDSSTHTFQLSNAPEADQPLSAWMSDGRAGFTGCWSNIGHALNYQPQAHGLTYVRDVALEGVTYRAYEWGPSTPLVIFRAQLGPPSGFRRYPLAVDQVSELRGNADHASGAMNVAIGYRFVSRGGPMTANTPMHVTATSTHANASSLGGIHHDHHATVMFSQLTCTLVDASHTLPDARSADLPSVGSSSAATPFQVSINCPNPGPAVELSLTDATQPGNRGSVLAPTADTTAVGVAVELLRNGQPVQFGQTWNHASDASGNTPAISLVARYHRIGATLTPGLVKGQAILTADYR